MNREQKSLLGLAVLLFGLAGCSHDDQPGEVGMSVALPKQRALIPQRTEVGFYNAGMGVHDILAFDQGGTKVTCRVYRASAPQDSSREIGWLAITIVTVGDKPVCMTCAASGVVRFAAVPDGADYTLKEKDAADRESNRYLRVYEIAAKD